MDVDVSSAVSCVPVLVLFDCLMVFTVGSLVGKPLNTEGTLEVSLEPVLLSAAPHCFSGRRTCYTLSNTVLNCVGIPPK